MASPGEMAGLTRLYEEHRPRLLAMHERRIDPAILARIDLEDLVGKVYLEARRRWLRFRSRADQSGFVWLCTIARDCLIVAWRKNHRKCRTVDRELPWPERSSVQLSLRLVQERTGPATDVEHHELAQRMHHALRQLRDPDRELLWIRHYDELAFADIAVVFGITKKTATVRYVRALRRLKDLWHNTHKLDRRLRIVRSQILRRSSCPSRRLLALGHLDGDLVGWDSNEIGRQLADFADS